MPIYWLCTTAVLLLLLYSEPGGDTPGVDTIDVIASYLFVPHFDVHGMARPILDVGWTLNYEMFFHLFFGLILTVKPQARALMLLALVFASIWLFVKVTPDLPFVVSHYGSPLTFEFLIGGAIAVWYQHPASEAAGKRPLLGAVLILVGLTALFLAGWYFAVDINYHPELRVAVFGVPAVLVVVGALLLERAGVTAKSRFVLLLGAASYSIYLVHQIPLGDLAPFFARTLPGTTDAHKLGALVFSFSLASAAGLLVYLWIERPLTAWLHSLFRRRPQPAMAV